MEDDKTTNDLINRIKKLEVQIEQAQLAVIKLTTLEKELTNTFKIQIQEASQKINEINSYLHKELQSCLNEIQFSFKF